MWAGEVSEGATGKQHTLPQPLPRADVSSPLRSLRTGSEKLSNFPQVTQLREW